jgi:hypothetical protein
MLESPVTSPILLADSRRMLGLDHACLETRCERVRILAFHRAGDACAPVGEGGIHRVVATPTLGDHRLEALMFPAG